MTDSEKAVSELDAYKKAMPLCDEHKPDGSFRGGCMVCAMMGFSSALSRIDYLCGEPNEMGVSAYDVFPDPEHVVKHVETRLAQAGVIPLTGPEVPLDSLPDAALGAYNTARCSICGDRSVGWVKKAGKWSLYDADGVIHGCHSKKHDKGQHAKSHYRKVQKHVDWDF